MKTSIVASLITLFSLSTALPTSALPRSEADKLFARDLWCYDDYRCDSGDAYNLANAYIGYGEQTCWAYSDWSQLDARGSCQVWVKTNSGDRTSSYCRDVGYGISNIAQSCDDGLGTTAGSNTAGGNGNYQIVMQTRRP